MNVVISQPMFLPWRGLFEQLLLSDVFVHYDDVQFPMGRNFCSRVQIKTKNGIKWLTVPIDKKNSGVEINQTRISYDGCWQEKHLMTIRHAYAKSKFKKDLNNLVEEIYAKRFECIGDFNIFSFELIASYFGIQRKMFRSSELSVDGSSSARLMEIVKKLGGDIYITGLGALNYIDYDLFEKNSISVEYMDYKDDKYGQIGDDFTPYVTILDVIANLGESGVDILGSPSVYWKEFIDERNRKI